MDDLDLSAARRIIEKRRHGFADPSSLDALAFAAARRLARAQPRADATIAQLPQLGTVLATDIVPVFHNGQTFGTPAGQFSSNVVLPVGVVNVLNYGAVGDGVTNDTAAVQRAIDAASSIALITPGNVYFPPSHKYLVSGLTITLPVKLTGSGLSTTGSMLITNNTAAPLLTISANAQSTIEGLAFVGPGPTAALGCDLIKIDTTNNVQIRDCFLTGGYNNIHYVGSGNNFYNLLLNVYFGDCVFAELYQEGGGATGCAMMISDCSVVGGNYQAQWGFRFDNYGALQIDNLLFNHANMANAGAGLYLNNPATLAGTSQIANTVFELEGATLAPGVWIGGSNAQNANSLYFSNTNIGGGGASGAAMRLDWVNNLYFSNCEITGYNGISMTQKNADCTFSNISFECLGYPIIAAATCSVSELTLIAPIYPGTGQFLNFGAISGAQIGNVTILGGTMGTNAAPIALGGPPTYGNRVYANVAGFQSGHLTAPAVPVSTAVFVNPFFNNVTVYIAGGTVTVIAIDGTATGLTSGSFRLPAGKSIAITYSVSPTSFVWVGD